MKNEVHGGGGGGEYLEEVNFNGVISSQNNMLWAQEFSVLD